MSDMIKARTVRQIGWLPASIPVSLVLLGGCTATVVTQQDLPPVGTRLVFARMLTVLTDRPGRVYDPALRFFEVRHRESGERYRVDVGADEKFLAFPLPPGEYEFTRLQISEGPFLSMADLSMVFQVGREGATYLGRWRLGVQSPRYGRKVLVSMARTDQGQGEDVRALIEDDPERQSMSVTVAEVRPTEAESRLYEVMPYPRYPTYFRRHLW